MGIEKFFRGNLIFLLGLEKEGSCELYFDEEKFEKRPLRRLEYFRGKLGKFIIIYLGIKATFHVETVS